MLVVRHAESTWNAEKRWSGQSDPPLTSAGRKAISRLADDLQDRGFTGVACSDLRRTTETAQALAAALHLPEPIPVPGLREREMGVWTGLTHDEIDRGWPGWRGRWKEEELLELPGGEHREAFDARVLSPLVELGRSRGCDDRLIVVGHAGTLRALGRHLGGLDRHPNLGGLWIIVRGESIRRGEG